MGCLFFTLSDAVVLLMPAEQDGCLDMLNDSDFQARTHAREERCTLKTRNVLTSHRPETQLASQTSELEVPAAAWHQCLFVPVQCQVHAAACMQQKWFELCNC